MAVTEKQIEYIVSLIETRKKSYDEISAGTGISKSTISRLMKQRNATAYTIDMLSAYFEVGEEMAALGGGEEARTSCPLVAGVSNELKRLGGLYEEREARMQAQCDERVSAIKAQMELLRMHYAEMIDNQEKKYDSNVAYLKSQVEYMQQERIQTKSELEAERNRANAAEATVKDMDRKRHNIFWIMGIICACLGVGLVVALFSKPII